MELKFGGGAFGGGTCLTPNNSSHWNARPFAAVEEKPFKLYSCQLPQEGPYKFQNPAPSSANLDSTTQTQFHPTQFHPAPKGHLRSIQNPKPSLAQVACPHPCGAQPDSWSPGSWRSQEDGNTQPSHEL